MVIADATGFPGWAAAIGAGVGVALVVLSLVGQESGFAMGSLGFWGVGLIGPSQLLFGLGVAGLGWPVALGGVAVAVGWCFPLVALVVSIGSIVWIPLGAGWIIFGIVNAWRRIVMPR